MKVVVGCLIVRDNKILMVKEAKKKCYGQWNIPAGHMEELEKITDTAIREVYEETGCKVKLTGVLPINCVNREDGETRIMIRFTADILDENIKFDTNEILDVKWIDLEKVKNMTDELRNYKLNLNFIKAYEENKIYPVDIFNGENFK